MKSTETDTLESIRSAARKLLEKELLPLVPELEEKGVFGHDVLKSLGRAGLAALMLPEPYGIDDLAVQGVVSEEMGYVLSGFALSVLASVCLFGSNVARLGTDEQKKKYLPGIASGEKVGCWALTEPGAGSDAVGISTRCERSGDHYLLNGSKTFITNAPIADYFIVIAREYEKGQAVPGFQGGTAFILERGMGGLKTGQPFEKHGHWSSPTGEIFLENAKVPLTQVLGSPREAFAGMKLSLDVERAVFSGVAIGIMRFCLDTMVKYASQRRQFGVPILEHQMVQEKIADVSANLEVLRTFADALTEKVSRGEPATKDAAILKLLSARYAVLAATEAVQTLGGYGYMREYGVERCLRDAKLFEIGGGTSEIQKMIIAKQTAREILGHAGS